MTSKIEILIRPKSEYGTRSDVAIHSQKPSVSKLCSHIDDALKNGFNRVVIYSNRKDSMHNIFNGRSTWNQLIRVYGDVRYGEVGFSYGRSVGDGFTIYMGGN